MIKEENINCTVEALVLASPEPVSIKRLCEVFEGLSAARIRQAVADLNNVYMGCGSSFRIREVAGGYQVYILPDFEQPIKKLLVKQRAVRLSRAALETLAIIAYKQPVAKTEIEHIRGVATDGVIHNLLQRQLVVIAGRAESPGRPLLYKTSSEFLKFFGLNRLSDLPRLDEIEEMIRMAETPREQTVLPLNGEEDVSRGDDDDEFDSEFDGADSDSDDMVASADISDLIGEADDGGDSVIQTVSGDNGSGSDEDFQDFEEEELLTEAESSSDDIESDTFGETAKIQPVVAYYEPIPDNPPVIFADSQIPSGESGGGNGNGSIPRDHATVSGEASEALDETGDTGDKPSED